MIFYPPLQKKMPKYKSIDVSEVVEISQWYDLDEGLAGSRDKRSVADPATDELYVFKEPKEFREAQIWSEVLASYICGDLLEWPVQHTSIALRDGKIGNLLRYIFDPSNQGLMFGEQLCKHFDPDFDPEIGRRHTWPLLMKIHDVFINGGDGGPRPHVSEEYRAYWARTIAFDTLISNTDRHAENWAFLLRNNPKAPPPEGVSLSIMAPFYDNASSMGCEVEEIGLKRWFTEEGRIQKSKIDKYTQRGCHHLRDGKKRYRFEDLSSIVLKEMPDMRSEFEAIADLKLTRIESVFQDIFALRGLPAAAKLTQQRQEQITRLLHEGQARVIRSLEE